MVKELTPIKVETLQNGYQLKVYNKQYLYFNEAELFEGIVYHAGMAIMKDANKGDIREAVSNLLSGGTKELMGRNQEQQMKICKLSEELKETREKNEKLTAKIHKIEKKKG